VKAGLQLRGTDIFIDHVIARSETTKQSPNQAIWGLLRYARNDILRVNPECVLREFVLYRLSGRPSLQCSIRKSFSISTVGEIKALHAPRMTGWLLVSAYLCRTAGIDFVTNVEYATDTGIS